MVRFLNSLPHRRKITVPMVENPTARAIKVITGGMKPFLTAQSLKKNIMPNCTALLADFQFEGIAFLPRMYFSQS